MIKFPEISPNFTIDDIRAIRRYDYEVTKGLTTEEKCMYYNNKEFREQIRRKAG